MGTLTRQAIVTAAAVLCGALALAPVPGWGQGGPAAVQVDPVSIVEVAETQPLIARLVSLSESLVATRIPGIVAEVHVRVGDRVARGDPLIGLDTELLTIEHEGAKATLLQAEAELEAALANRDLAEQIYQRTDQLRGSAAFSQGRSDDLAKELARARAELARSEAALAVARSAEATTAYRLDKAVVRAPFEGVVLSREASAGDYLQAGGAVARLLDDRDLEVEADVPTEIVGALDPGERVATLSDDGVIGEARVRAVVPSESMSTRTRPVRFSIDMAEGDKELAPGQSVTVLAPVGDPREALSVAKDALVQRVGGWMVFVVEDGKAVPRPVTIGAAVEDRIEVEGSLTPGELVVVRGNERLRPGQEVAYQEPPADAVAVGSAAAEADEATN